MDIGHALGVLRGDGVAEALGRASFEELCREDLQMAPTTVRKMIAQHFRRETVLTLGADRAQALIELAEATPEDDTPEGIMYSTLTLPSGERLDVARATAAELHDAAREIRQKHKSSRRGLTVSAAHRKLYGQYNQRLKRARARGAKLKLIASRDKEGAWVELRVRLSDLDAVTGALRSKKLSGR